MTDLTCEAVGAPIQPTKVNFRKAKGLCLECRIPLKDTGRRSVAKFCGKPCHTIYHNRAKTEGALLLNAIKRWRRYGGKGSFTAVTRIADKLIKEDKELGRDVYPPPPVWTQAISINVAHKRRSSVSSN